MITLFYRQLIKSQSQSHGIPHTKFNRAFISSLFVIYHGFLVSASRKLSSYPPGPKGLPIISKMSMMPQMSHHHLAQLA